MSKIHWRDIPVDCQFMFRIIITGNTWIKDGSSVMVTGFGKMSEGSVISPVNLQEGLLRVEANKK